MTWTGVPADPTSPTWDEYRTATSGPVPEDEWDRYVVEAERVIDDVTLGRAAEETVPSVLAKVIDATYRVADALYAADTGIVSERLGSYSYTRSGTFTRADADRVAVRALSCTGLTYRGI